MMAHKRIQGPRLLTRYDWANDTEYWWFEPGYWFLAHSGVMRALWLLGWRQVTLDGWFFGGRSTWCTPWNQQMRHWTLERGVHFIPRHEWKRLYRLYGLTGYTERRP